MEISRYKDLSADDAHIRNFFSLEIIFRIIEIIYGRSLHVLNIYTEKLLR